MVRRIVFFLLLSVIALPANAQFYGTKYRVPNQDWKELNSEHFRLIYPARYHNEAYRSMAILESEYSDIQELVGGDLSRFPFILNPENDRSNGFVSPINFRSEVELSPIISKSMNPKSGSWLELVLPHELVHALHFSSDPESLTRLLTTFSPDLRRSVHSAAPLGFLEGIAVEYESHNTLPQAGRGHYPYFRNQFWSVLDTRQEWSMGQLIHTTTYTPPYNRHYVGGYEFVNWLLDTYGSETMERAIEFHYHYPFLGFGTALRNETGEWPGKLHEQFNRNKKEKRAEYLEESEDNTDLLSEEIPFQADCKLLHRPKWLDNSTLIFIGQSCNRTYGFYTYRFGNENPNLLEEVSVSDDFIYSISEDGNELTYSRYYADLLYDNLFQGDLHRLDLSSGRSQRITKNKRLFSPADYGNHLLAVQTQSEDMALVRLDPKSGAVIHKYVKPDHSTIIQAAPHPSDPDVTAIIGRINSVQGIWFENLNERDSILHTPPEIVFEKGSVFDLSWHPSEDKFLFVSDHTGTMNVYEYDILSESIHQITNSKFNAFEASYSPDGTQIAFILQDGNEQTLHTLSHKHFLNREISKNEWQYDDRIEELINRPLMGREIAADSTGWESRSYTTGLSWLKPRLWFPTFEEIEGYNRPGVTFESVDVMGSQAYSLDMSVMADRFWYDASYTYKGFYPGFRVELFDAPTLTTFQIEEDEEVISQQLLQRSRGASFEVPIPLTLENNMRFSSIYLEPHYSVSQIRFLNPGNSSEPVSNFATRHTVGFRAVYNLNVRQFIRDVQPNSGWAFFIEGRHALNRDQFNIETDLLSIEGNLVKRRGFRAGIIRFISPLKRWNQSLRISARVYSQTDVPVFGLTSQYSDLFSENPLPAANNVGLLDARYTIPLIYPDDGGLLLPFYLSNIYLVLFSQTTTDLEQPDLLSTSRSVLGAGIRSRFRISNLALDIGISIGWQPDTNDITYHIGNF